MNISKNISDTKNENVILNKIDIFQEASIRAGAVGTIFLYDSRQVVRQK